MITTFKSFGLVLVTMFAIAGCTTQMQEPVPADVVSDLRVVSVNVEVPRTLTVSEADTIKPVADIVWHEDPMGDRYAQVESVVREAIEAGAKTATGNRAVSLDVVVTRFHAQTNRVRYSGYPSEHETEFNLTIRDAATGAVLSSRHVDATFKAYNGATAVAADKQGITQRMRIVEYVKTVIAQELRRPI
ncbi:DUF6778 family protein [Celeribacter arenosi]|uniref:Lipoprotein n=1 Tax=Celeribacter arenosi TaxID=792649 RepID=A0ABP7KFB3_9RHOB